MKKVLAILAGVTFIAFVACNSGSTSSSTDTTSKMNTMKPAADSVKSAPAMTDTSKKMGADTSKKM